MDMTSTDWWSAIGQTVVVTGLCFVALCVVTSWVRFQMMAENARENEELGQGEDKAFRLSVLNAITSARRQRQPLSLVMLRLPEAGPSAAEVERMLRTLVRSGDAVAVCGPRLVGLLLLCGSERTVRAVERLVADTASAGLAGSANWRFGVSGYPEHGFKTSVLYARALTMLEQAEATGVRVAGMADAEAVADEKAGGAGVVDPLTGLIHEEKMIGVMRRYIAQERRAERPVSMLYFMIDQLERVTQLHGAASSEASIKELAALLSRSTRESDMLARFGADGFIVALPATPAQALAIAQRIGQDVRKQVFVPGRGVKLSVSAGVAGYPDIIGSAVQYFVAAEAALKEARSRGRSQFVAYHPGMTVRAEGESGTQHL